MSSEFDTDTGLERGDDGRWHGAMTDRWWIGAGPNGGYIASFLIRAMIGEATQPDPLTMTTHYLDRPAVAPVEVAVEHLHAGRSHQFLHARLLQEDRPVAVATATFGRLREGDPVSMQGEIPPWERLENTRPDPTEPMPGMTFRERFNYRLSDPSIMPFSRSEPGPAHLGGWMQFADGRPLDALAVPLFMDSWPPPMFATFLGGGAPTIELTVHWRNRPRTAWHLADFRSRFLLNGYTEEDGELWDEEGRLIAQSRQLARFALNAPPSPPPSAPG